MVIPSGNPMGTKKDGAAPETQLKEAGKEGMDAWKAGAQAAAKGVIAGAAIVGEKVGGVVTAFGTKVEEHQKAKQGAWNSKID